MSQQYVQINPGVGKRHHHIPTAPDMHDLAGPIRCIDGECNARFRLAANQPHPAARAYGPSATWPIPRRRRRLSPLVLLAFVAFCLVLIQVHNLHH